MVNIKRGNWVEFNFYRPGARDVSLVGDFNDWQVGATPMRPLRKGSWVARLRLRPGRYRFRYQADGQWFTDYASFGIDHGPFGMDSLVWVPPRSGKTGSRRARQHAGSAH